MKVKLGFVLLAIMLLSLAGASSAEQLVRVGYAHSGLLFRPYLALRLTIIGHLIRAGLWRRAL
jgi:hypothetical protein